MEPAYHRQNCQKTTHNTKKQTPYPQGWLNNTQLYKREYWNHPSLNGEVENENSTSNTTSMSCWTIWEIENITALIECTGKPVLTFYKHWIVFKSYGVIFFQKCLAKTHKGGIMFWQKEENFIIICLKSATVPLDYFTWHNKLIFLEIW